MEISQTSIPGVLILDPGRHTDERGWLSELWNPDALGAAGLDVDFVQDNQSHNSKAGPVRGLHFQVPPHAQGKLITCLSGAIFDVAVDLRVGSPTYGRHVGLRMDADDTRQMWIPAGFAHGYCALEDNTRVLYKLTAPFAPHAAKGIRWDDPALGIAWPLEAGMELVNDRDRNLPCLADYDSPFRWDG
ncbi:MAG: dTDP-4-dehydrorhamnose 3,5-epimerase [Alphaproteobacteria bacterium]|nr:dTDP-4-dehydrorhamnose 3,5-epimerase [Alphaproteobacteria bacterium]